jgi:hypothetical protein
MQTIWETASQFRHAVTLQIEGLEVMLLYNCASLRGVRIKANDVANCIRVGLITFKETARPVPNSTFGRASAFGLAVTIPKSGSQ